MLMVCGVLSTVAAALPVLATPSHQQTQNGFLSTISILVVVFGDFLALGNVWRRGIRDAHSRVVRFVWSGIPAHVAVEKATCRLYRRSGFGCNR
jgi:hypothetical protein